VNVNLAPVADIASVPGRSCDPAFPGGGAQVGRLAAATVDGYGRGGVLATVKHFPGLGRSTVNTDFGAATVPAAAS
jgi:beta-N-acetylhexosaminidase